MSMVEKIKVVVTDQAFGSVENEQRMASRVGAQFSDHQCATEEETLKVVKGASVVFNNFAPITPEVMKVMAPGATVIRYGVGVDNVDLVAANQLGIHVCNVPDYGVDEVADHAMAMILALARKLALYDKGIRNQHWSIKQIVGELKSLRDCQVGLVGFGRIARSLSTRLEAFGCKIQAYDPYVNQVDINVDMVAFEQLVDTSNIVSFHLPYTPETHHILNAEMIARMPKGAIVINVSRGGLIDEEALAKAVQRGHIFGAGLDVFEREPLPENSPLRDCPNMWLTPHAAFYSEASVRNLQRLAAEEGERAINHEPLRCELTRF
ncbi:putative D-3-phosphoglycerate dehydrogenase [Vibrio nigripulchritudo SFn27]|uniref:Putative D-3-phosphoglycerate dehydrogenase n=1 Tax=Vibrio nigripulchritudo TaxID=28173 RepID=U4KF51_9VIBR|nr:C-terminal binding protein [Vibrio nigripulchritudo]CCN85241.1 putative D-3-phosphoglycerate dehydrogenase [Vibrio nigripulchritudo BLFn1]CCN87609.1 putative D-3-phosphoglycerate dehydrogenase [Vibrio nigripulchritudo SFn27]CCN92490.1 putative D-3-phosphoglycerate dehydrogenase [Vibrio nigripulchritudo ENn2]CCO39353.1 putative D-3-phosphoglycerate dehydrogenase [Vibrio nigripulchritudo SFn135]CCO53419.1 putative D-3-phosphoglycerate dehydrogenase [Vibrio nigripulchritudo Wn13]